jgi:hypothetical protein
VTDQILLEGTEIAGLEQKTGAEKNSTDQDSQDFFHIILLEVARG